MGLIKVKTVNKVVMIRQGWVRPRVKINRIAPTDAGGGGQSDTRTLPYSILAVHLASPRSSLTPPFGRRCRHPDRAHPSSDRGQSVGPVFPIPRPRLNLTSISVRMKWPTCTYYKKRAKGGCWWEMRDKIGISLVIKLLTWIEVP